MSFKKFLALGLVALVAACAPESEDEDPDNDEAEVTSARHLNDDEVAELKTMLKAKLGKEPRLQSRIDPTLLGGLVVKVGSRMIDSSLRTKLDSLRAAMKG